MVDQAVETMKSNLAEKTGRSLDAWLALIQPMGFERHGEVMKYLKSEHAMTHGYANFVALNFLETKTGKLDESELVDSQFSGAKAELRPAYDAVIEAVLGLGADVEIAPKKSSVSLRRRKQFALVTVSTKTRIDLGLNLKDEPVSGLLLADKGMCTHKIALASADDVDAEVISFLRKAYELA